LWKDYHSNQFIRPFYHGVVGPQFDIPYAEPNTVYHQIASPMPRPDYTTRIIPNDLPPKTYSPTSFDLPMRKDVMQSYLPVGRTETIESHLDPRLPPLKPVPVVQGTMYHGTKSVDPLVNHGLNTDPFVMHSFLQKKMKKKARKSRKSHKKSKQDRPIGEIRRDATGMAHTADIRSSHILNLMTPWPAMNLGTMVLPVEMLNKRDPTVKQYADNRALYDRLHDLRLTPQGVRSAHTRRFLPLA